MSAPAVPVGPARWSGPGRIGSAADVDAVLAAVRAASGHRSSLAELRRPVASAADATGRDSAGYLPVHPQLAPLLPWPGGLRRGATVAATGANSLLLTLLAGAMTAGGFAAVVGLPELGMVAAAEHHIPLPRLALVPAPGPDWPAAVAALLDGLDLVVVATAGDVAAGTARALAARARSRGAVLVPTRPWPGADLLLTATGHRYTGLGAGHGRIRGQEMTVQATGRGAAARPRQVTIAVPAPALDQPPSLRLRVVDPVDEPAPLSLPA